MGQTTVVVAPPSLKLFFFFKNLKTQFEEKIETLIVYVTITTRTESNLSRLVFFFFLLKTYRRVAGDACGKEQAVAHYIPKAPHYLKISFKFLFASCLATQKKNKKTTPFTIQRESSEAAYLSFLSSLWDPFQSVLTILPSPITKGARSSLMFRQMSKKKKKRKFSTLPGVEQSAVPLFFFFLFIDIYLIRESFFFS